ncbi:MAG: carbon-nitrogen hydrolase family protein [Aestuariibacter sp.]
MSHMGIAGLQLELTAQNNLAFICGEIARVKRRFPWVEMFVVGELACHGFDLNKAENAGGETEQTFCTLAEKLGVWIIPGSYYEKHQDKVFNTTPVINPAGEVVTRYRKIYPFLPYEKGVTSGDEFVVFDVPNVGRFGVSICYDGWFPETTRSLVAMGAEVIIHPTLTNTNDREQETIMARANAIMNQCYFVDINVAPPLGNGGSIVSDHNGDVVHQAGSKAEVIAFELDLNALRRARERGIKNLGQPLKSFRDNGVKFPAYNASAASSETLNELGKLEVPAAVNK